MHSLWPILSGQKEKTATRVIYAFSLAQFKRSEGENCHGAPLFSILANIDERLAGAFDSSITRYLLSSTIIFSGSMFMGQASVQALQLVHAHNSSAVI
jgi:hypothetical protein